MRNNTEMAWIDFGDRHTNVSESGEQGRLLNPQYQKAIKSANYQIMCANAQRQAKAAKINHFAKKFFPLSLSSCFWVYPEYNIFTQEQLQLMQCYTKA